MEVVEGTESLTRTTKLDNLSAGKGYITFELHIHGYLQSPANDIA